ncbi:MAG: hypothetical protein LAO24_12495 [Acidobacteriia bacterium]|nr:hypothetical protein [Terriglobia bacterium]
MGSNSNSLFNQVSGISSIFGLVLTGMPLLKGIGQYAPAWAPLTTAERLNMLLHLSILTLIAHGLLWAGLERVLGWDYATGKTPKGFRAVVMSLSLTVPALTVPLLYQSATAKTVVSSNHLHGAVFALAGGAIAYVVLFGVHDVVFPGVREVLLRRFGHRPLGAETLATLAYALILIVLIATPYRLLVAPQTPAHIFLGRPVWASLVTFFGVTAYLLLKYPNSVQTRGYWVHLRGFIAGMFTVVSVCTALYA